MGSDFPDSPARSAPTVRLRRDVHAGCPFRGAGNEHDQLHQRPHAHRSRTHRRTRPPPEQPGARQPSGQPRGAAAELQVGAADGPGQAGPGDARRIRRATRGAAAHPRQAQRTAARGGQARSAACRAVAERPSRPRSTERANMGLALVHSRARAGVGAPAVRVEVHLSGGLPRMSIVGLPEAAVREAKDRVRAAIQCAQFEFPARRITVNLAPADLPKDGGRFDLAIALGILAASEQIPLDALNEYEFLGELGLTGELRAIDGVLPAALAAARAGRKLVVPAGNGAEAALASQVEASTARTLLEVCAALEGRKALPAAVALPTRRQCRHRTCADVRGQAQARRALEVAAAGGHHLLLVGPPGCGKTLLASRLTGLLPEPIGRRSAGGGGDRLGQRTRPRSDALAGAAVPQPAPHRQRGRAGRRRRATATGRDFARAQRRAVPRRAARMGPARAGSAARAARIRRRHDLARRAAKRIPGALPAGGGDESLSLRLGRRSIRSLPLQRRGDPALPRRDLRAVARPHRPARRRAAPAAVATAARRARTASPATSVRAAGAAARALQHARAGKANAQLGQAETMATAGLAPHDQILLERAIDALQLSARSHAPHPARRAHDRRPGRQPAHRDVASERSARVPARRPWPREHRRLTAPPGRGVR